MDNRAVGTAAYAGVALLRTVRSTTPMPRSSLSSTTAYALPTRRGHAPLELAAVDARLVAPLDLTGHGKPASALPAGDRRTAARRAAFRTPPR